MSYYMKKTSEDGKVNYFKIDSTDEAGEPKKERIAKNKIAKDILARLDVIDEDTPVSDQLEIDTDSVETATDEMNSVSQETRKVSLKRPILINGKAYKDGTIVSVDLAEDLERIDEQNTQYQADLHRDQAKALESANITQ